MKSATLTRLYFESTSPSKGSAAWFLFAAFAHIALLFYLPAPGCNFQPQSIVFLQGEAGVEVELLPDNVAPPPQADPAQSVSEQTTVATMALPHDDEVAAETDFTEPVHKHTSVRPPNVKRTRREIASAPNAGTAVAQPASKIFTPQPPYPPQARSLGIEGSVRLRVRVAVDGSPRVVEILRSSGRTDFDSASLSTVRRAWRFRPARSIDGTPVESAIVVAIQFVLHS